MLVSRLRRAVTADEAGISLVEVILAMFVLSVALLALGSVATSSLISLRDTRDREQAVNAASAAIEDVRSRDFVDVVHTAGDVDITRLPEALLADGAGDTCFDLTRGDGLEPVVTGDSDRPVPFERTSGDRDLITVHTVVTYEQGDCATGAATPLKRVTVVASWGDAGLRHSVVQETLVADVARGLPVPRFEIRPPTAGIRFSEAFLTEESDPIRCAEHQVRNLGAEDGYDFAVEPIDPDASPPQPILYNPTFHAYDVASVWRVTAWLEDDPPVATREGEPPAGSDGQFREDATFPRPVTDTRLPAGASGLLTVCYEPLTDVAGLPDELETRIVLRSRFDERQEREVVHRVWLGDAVDDGVPGTPLYLFEVPDNVPHARRTVPMVMGALDEDPAPDSVRTLSTHGYGPEVANWSTDIMPGENLPGVRIGHSEAFQLRWHYQFGSRTTLLQQATLVLWVAPPQALTGGLGSISQPMAVRVQVDELSNQEAPINNGWVRTVVHEYVHTTPQSASTGGWQRVEIPVDLGAERIFNNNRYVRLRVGCAVPESLVSPAPEGPFPADCNIAYDNESFPAAFYIQEK